MEVAALRDFCDSKSLSSKRSSSRSDWLNPAKARILNSWFSSMLMVKFLKMKIPCLKTSALSRSDACERCTFSRSAGKCLYPFHSLLGQLSLKYYRCNDQIMETKVQDCRSRADRLSMRIIRVKTHIETEKNEQTNSHRKCGKCGKKPIKPIKPTNSNKGQGNDVTLIRLVGQME